MRIVPYEERVRVLMTAATSFASILLAEGGNNDEVVMVGAEMAADLLDRVEYESEKYYDSRYGEGFEDAMMDVDFSTDEIAGEEANVPEDQLPPDVSEAEVPTELTPEAVEDEEKL